MAAAVRRRTTIFLNLASIIERADEQVLPAVYHFISRSMHASPSQLGTLTLCRAMVQASSISFTTMLASEEAADVEFLVQQDPTSHRQEMSKIKHSDLSNKARRKSNLFLAFCNKPWHRF